MKIGKLFWLVLFFILLASQSTPSYAGHSRTSVDFSFSTYGGPYYYDPYYDPYYYHYHYYDPYYYEPTYVVAPSEPVIVTQPVQQIVVTQPTTPVVVTQPAAPVVVQDIFTINVPNDKGGYTAVVIKKSGNGYVGPQGEYYTEFPKVSQLRMMYGK